MTEPLFIFFVFLWHLEWKKKSRQHNTLFGFTQILATMVAEKSELNVFLTPKPVYNPF
jgi:hypothetical protein